LQILGQYGSEELRVHIALRGIPRIHDQGDRLDQLSGIAPRFASLRSLSANASSMSVNPPRAWNGT